MPQANQSEVVRRAPITQRQFEMMMAVLLRHESSFKTASIQLTPDRFAEKHRGFAAMWAVATDHYTEYKELPSDEYLAGEIERRLDEDPDAMTDEGLAELDEFLNFAYEIAPENIDNKTLKVSMRFLKTYLEDRLSDNLRTTMGASSYTPVDMCTLLQDYQVQHSRMSVLDPVGLSVPFPSGWEDSGPQVIKSSTGIDFFDKMLNGGQARGEVYGLLGPMGSCKTTFAVQYAVKQAALLRSEWRQQLKKGNKTPLPIVYYFFYEASMAEFRVRALSAHGEIDRTTLEGGKWDELSKQGHLKPYERRRWKDAIAIGKKPLGEHERFKQAQKVLNLNLRMIDMTGNDEENPGRGCGMVPEIAQIIEMDQSQRKHRGQACRVGAVVIDYAGVAVKRFLDSEGKDYQSNIRHYIGSFGMQCKNSIALHFDTPVLCLHQFSGKANSFQPGVLAQSTDAAEAKNWMENLDFSFLIGKPNGDNLAVFGRDKGRRAPPCSNIIIKITGDLSRVDHATKYVVDPVRQTIVHQDDVRSVEGEEDAVDGMQMDSYEDTTVVPTEVDNIAIAASSGAGRRRRRV